MANKILVSSDTRYGQLVQIVTRVDDTNPDEVRAYRVLMEVELSKCDNCGHDMRDIPTGLMQITVPNPLQDLFGMDIGEATPICPHCGVQLICGSSIDLAAFPATIKFLTDLRAEYERRRAAATVKAINKNMETLRKGKENG